MIELMIKCWILRRQYNAEADQNTRTQKQAIARRLFTNWFMGTEE